MIAEASGGHDSQRVAVPIVAFARLWAVAVNPVRKQFEPSLELEPLLFVLLDESAADRDEGAANVGGEPRGEFGDDSFLAAAKLAGHAVSEVPDPGDLEILDRGQEAEATEAEDVVDVDDVGIEVLDLGDQYVNIVRVEET